MLRHTNRSNAMTLVESLTVIVILGIVLFITLPHLTQSRASSDLIAMKAKAVQLNAAKNAYIAAYGMDNAQSQWIGHTRSSTQLYQLMSPYLPAGANPSSNDLAGYVVNGYTIGFTQDIKYSTTHGGSLINVTAPVIVKTYSGGVSGTTPIVY